MDEAGPQAGVPPDSVKNTHVHGKNKKCPQPDKKTPGLPAAPAVQTVATPSTALAQSSPASKDPLPRKKKVPPHKKTPGLPAAPAVQTVATPSTALAQSSPASKDPLPRKKKVPPHEKKTPLKSKSPKSKVKTPVTPPVDIKFEGGHKQDPLLLKTSGYSPSLQVNINGRMEE